MFGIMIVSDREMALLHRYGVAREYEMIDEQKVVVKWKKGQRFESGAKVSEGGRCASPESAKEHL